MKITQCALLADENINREVIDYLRNSGCDIETVRSMNLEGDSVKIRIRR